MSLARDVAARIRAAIDLGEYAPGDRLPPVRDLALVEHVGSAVVGQAYAILAREGRIVSRVGRGTFVARHRPAVSAPLVDVMASRRGGTPSAALDLQERLAGIRRAGKIDLSAGLPIVDDAIAAAVSAELEAVVREEGARLFGYVAPRGDPALRGVAAAAWQARGLAVDAEAILVTTSGQQAIDLAVRSIVAPGDVVLCEAPTYGGAIDSLLAARARVVPVPIDRDGLLVDALEDLARRERPRLLFLNPTGNNVTGTVLTAVRRQRVVDLAATYDFLVLEDDTGAELVFDGEPPAPVAALDEDSRVVLVKSFAKTVLPGLRLGVIFAPATLERDVLAAKLVADRFTAPPLTRALARYLEQPMAAVHLDRIKQTYRARRDALVLALERRLGDRARWTVPDAGFNLWLELPAGIDEDAALMRAVDAGVVVSPGCAYVPPGVVTRHARLSFSGLAVEDADRAVASLARAWRPSSGARRGRSPEDDGFSV